MLHLSWGTRAPIDVSGHIHNTHTYINRLGKSEARKMMA